MPAVQVMFFRSLIPSLFLLPVAGREKLEQPLSRPQLRSLILRGLAGASAMLTYFLAILWSPISMATLTSNTSPLWTVLLASLFLGESIPRSLRIGLPITFLGCALLALKVDSAALAACPTLYQGLAVGFLSAVFSAMAYINVRLLRAVPPSWVALSLTLTSMVAVLPFLPSLPWAITQPQVGWIALLGLAGGFAQYLMTVGYQFNSAGKAATLGLSTAPCAAVFGALFLHEYLTVPQFAGLVMVLGGTAIVTSSK